MNALNELAHGVSFDKVSERYKLKRKRRHLKVVDKRKQSISSRVLTSDRKLSRALE